MKNDNIVVIYEGNAYEVMQLIEIIKEKNIEAWTNSDVTDSLNVDQKAQILVNENNKDITISIINPIIDKWNNEINSSNKEDLIHNEEYKQDEEILFINDQPRYKNPVLVAFFFIASIAVLSFITYYLTMSNKSNWELIKTIQFVLLIFIIFAFIIIFGIFIISNKSFVKKNNLSFCFPHLSKKELFKQVMLSDEELNIIKKYFDITYGWKSKTTIILFIIAALIIISLGVILQDIGLMFLSIFGFLFAAVAFNTFYNAKNNLNKVIENSIKFIYKGVIIEKEIFRHTESTNYFLTFENWDLSVEKSVYNKYLIGDNLKFEFTSCYGIIFHISKI